MKKNQGWNWRYGLKLRPFLVWTILLGLVLQSAVNLGVSVDRLIHIGLDTRAQSDFYGYWYSGQFIRQGINPYDAFFKDKRTSVVQKNTSFTRAEGLAFPIRFLDGSLSTQEALAGQTQVMSTVPANTAPFLLVIALLSYFSWPIAGVLWFVINLCLMLAIPYLAWLFTERSGLKLPPALKMISYLLFFSLDGSRTTLTSGQTTFFALSFALLALVLQDHRRDTLAGIALGLALSKYHVALPVMLLVLLQRNFKTFFVAALVQIAGILVLAALTLSSPINIVVDYAKMASFNATLANAKATGVHLAAYLPPNFMFDVGVAILLTLGLLVLTIPPFVAQIKMFLSEASTTAQRHNKRMIEIHVLAILMSWLLLAVYHLKYDAGMTIISIYLIMLAFLNSDRWALPRTGVTILTSLLLISLLLLIYAFPVWAVFFPAFPLELVMLSQTVSILILLGSSIVLFRRLQLSDESDQRSGNVAADLGVPSSVPG